MVGEGGGGVLMMGVGVGGGGGWVGVGVDRVGGMAPQTRIIAYDITRGSIHPTDMYIVITAGRLSINET